MPHSKRTTPGGLQQHCWKMKAADPNKLKSYIIKPLQYSNLRFKFSSRTPAEQPCKAKLFRSPRRIFISLQEKVSCVLSWWQLMNLSLDLHSGTHLAWLLVQGDMLFGLMVSAHDYYPRVWVQSLPRPSVPSQTLLEVETNNVVLRGRAFLSSTYIAKRSLVTSQTCNFHNCRHERVQCSGNTYHDKITVKGKFV